jgi:(1->4)-alpha-D-glucan 1-alpha-D-glucosylmutase
MNAPTSTYRLQLRRGVDLAAARALVPYLRDLGVAYLYVSPVQRAKAGSPHGYDLVDPLELDPVLGDEEDFAGLAEDLHACGMGLLLDVVPNHLAACFDNPLWRDVLEHGPASPHAAFFDVDWHAEPVLVDRVLVPVLGRPYGETLERGELKLAIEEERIILKYFEHWFPLDPCTWSQVLGHRAERLAEDLGSGHAAVVGLGRLLARIGEIPPRGARSRTSIDRRQRIAASARRGLRRLREEHGELAAFVEQNLRSFDGLPGQPRSYDALDGLLLQQAYRLVFWRSGYERLNYRRFFNVNELVGVRVEDDRVFDTTHAWILEQVALGRVDGLRVDHVDGLYDPLGYLERLQRAIAARRGGPGYVVVEKVLATGERLPEWPVAGTTGYDALDALNGLFVDPRGLEALDAAYARESGTPTRWEDLVTTQKRRTLHRYFTPEILSLERHLRALAAMDRHGRDLAPQALARALREVTASLPVYRTYSRGDGLSEDDRRVVHAAIEDAARRGEADPRAVAFLGRVLLQQLPPGLSDGERSTWLRFVLRWQQITGPAMAKGVEDTAFYIYNRLVGLNEVGSEPVGPKDPIGHFHAFAASRQAGWPTSLNATSTHDTKRSEDVRARLAVLSEIPDRWCRAVKGFSEQAELAFGAAPDLYQRSLLFQTLVGAWPLDERDLPRFEERIVAYLVKAAREAKIETDWLDPNPLAEEVLVGFARAFLRSEGGGIPAEFLALHRIVSFHGACNGLSQVVLKLAMPGVPDVYQGNETWDFSLVDPDNRRRVDFAARAEALGELGAARDVGALVRDLLGSWTDGRIKLYVTSRLLRARRRRPRLFLEGRYVPLDGGDHAVAFARSEGDDWAIAIAPRLTTELVPAGRFALGAVWGAWEIPLPEGAPTQWHNPLTGQVLRTGGAVPLAEALSAFPVALLESG